MNADMDENLTPEDIGHILEGKAQKLITESDDPEVVIREVMNTLARSDHVESAERTVDEWGRVSLGRGLAGKHGLVLFNPEGDGDE